MPGVEASAGAERLFDIVQESFKKYEVPLLNIVACCTDGCKTMIGHVSGLKWRLKKVIPHLIFIQCPAHKTALCCSHASKFLPNEILELITDLYSMLNSSHKLHNFEVIQIELGLPLQKILKYIYTRWLAMLHCVDRDLEQWPALLEFANKQKDEEDKLALKVYNLMKQNDTICYFYLLKRVLNI